MGVDSGFGPDRYNMDDVEAQTFRNRITLLKLLIHGRLSTSVIQVRALETD